MKKVEYEGLLSMHSWGDADDVLFLSSVKDPLADALSWISGKVVSVRYWIADRQCSKDDAMTAALMSVLGVSKIGINSRYSDLTGYLWTDEDLMVGGHDLLAEFKSNVGKWLFLEIEVGGKE